MPGGIAEPEDERHERKGAEREAERRERQQGQGTFLFPDEEEQEAPDVPRHHYRTVHIQTPVQWEHWFDFYNEVIDPLVSEGAELDIHVTLHAHSDEGIDINTVELRIRESLMQRGLDALIEVDS